MVIRQVLFSIVDQGICRQVFPVEFADQVVIRQVLFSIVDQGICRKFSIMVQGMDRHIFSTDVLVDR